MRKRKKKQSQEPKAHDAAQAPQSDESRAQEPWPEEDALGDSARGAAVGGALGGPAGAAHGALWGLLGSSKSKKNSIW